MTFRAPLIRCDTTQTPYRNEPDPELLQLLTAEQWRYFAITSNEYGKPVDRLLLDFMPMAEQVGDTNTVRLVGLLPSCGLYGCLDPDGRTHT